MAAAEQRRKAEAEGESRVHRQVGDDSTQRFRFEKRLGAGAFGEVWKAYDKELKRIVAVKKLFKPKLDQKLLQDEINTFRALQRGDKCHPNIVCYHGSVSCNDSFCVIMEYIDGCTLQDVINSRRFITDDEAKHIAQELIKGLIFMHSRGTVHRDIKPENVMYTSGGKVAFVDFGLSCTRYRYLARRPRCMEHWVGTPIFLAPERSNYRMPTGMDMLKAADVWSLGTTLYELLHLRFPFVSSQGKGLLNDIKKCYIIPPWRTSLSVCRTLRSAIVCDWTKRATASQMAKYLSGEEIPVVDSIPIGVVIIPFQRLRKKILADLKEYIGYYLYDGSGNALRDEGVKLQRVGYDETNGIYIVVSNVGGDRDIITSHYNESVFVRNAVFADARNTLPLPTLEGSHAYNLLAYQHL